jgi:hypothetical protein
MILVNWMMLKMKQPKINYRDDIVSLLEEAGFTLTFEQMHSFKNRLLVGFEKDKGRWTKDTYVLALDADENLMSFGPSTYRVDEERETYKSEGFDMEKFKKWLKNQVMIHKLGR